MSSFILMRSAKKYLEYAECHSAVKHSYVNFFSGPMSVVLILNTSFLFRSNASSVLNVPKQQIESLEKHLWKNILI